MFHVKDDFRAGAPVTQVGAGWFNKVGSFLNNLVSGRGIRLIKNEGGVSVIALEEGIGSGGSGTVKSVDGVKPDAAGNVDLGALTGDDVDVEGGVLGFEADGVTSGAGLSVVTDVKWNASNHRLTVTKRTLKFKKGLVVSTGTAATTTVDTATLVTWS